MAGEIRRSSCQILTFLWHLSGESLKKRIFLTMHKFEGQFHAFCDLTLIELDFKETFVRLVFSVIEKYGTEKSNFSFQVQIHLYKIW